MRYAIIDLEVTADTTCGRFCNPLDSSNVITSIALRANDKTYTKYDAQSVPRDTKLNLMSYDLIVGQNIKFDLLYLWSNPDLQSWIERGGQVWDTMLAEYLLRGQQGRAHGGQEADSLSLDALSAKYGGTSKDKQMKWYFESGYKCNQIPKDQLLEYNAEDVANTEIIFLKQYESAKKKGMLPLMKVYMNHLLALCEMEFNGLHVDLEEAQRLKHSLEVEEVELRTDLMNEISKSWTPHLGDFVLSSPKLWSLYLFGGVLKTHRYVDAGFFKTGARAGLPKVKVEKLEYNVTGLYPVDEDWLTKKAGVYSVDDDVLDVLIRRHNSQLLKTLRRYREVLKLLSTYFTKEHLNKDGEVKSVSGILTKRSEQTNCIHSEFNMTFTETGRLSSSNPNIQNLPPSILGIFKSRYGESGCIIEADFSQLEVVVQAYLSQCFRMIKDLEDGVDFHRLRLSYALDKSYEDVVNVKDYSKKRKEIAKPISFQKAYGAMPQTVSNRTGIALSIVEKVFNAEDKVYPEIQEFYKTVHESLQKTRTLLDLDLTIKDKQNKTNYVSFGEKQALGTYKSLTGKIYTFKEKGVRTKRGDVFRYFQIPEIQNYPVQGTAADIVAMQVGEVFRELLNHRDKCVMVNEVHDSLIIDCKKEHKDLIIEKISGILSSVPSNFKKYFKIEFNVPIKVDVKVGDNWLNCKED